MNRRRLFAGLSLIVLLSLLLVATTPQPAKAGFFLVTPIKSFTPAATYTNKTMPFEIGDVYGGYSYFTLSGGGTQGFDNIDAYATDCDGGEHEFFGFDEFVNHSLIYTETEWELFHAPAATFDVVALGYFYQKTGLDENNRWALAIVADETGFYLVHNTGNGNEPTNTTLASETFESGTEYFISIENDGDGYTDIFINETTHPYTFSYSGSVQTGNYEAHSLYAGFGNTAYTGVNVWTYNFYLMIMDTILTSPSDGTGLSKIDVYTDDVFAGTLFDVDQGASPALEVNATVANITLVVDCWLNATTAGIATVSEGRNRIRHNITVTIHNGSVIFSQNNLTFISGIDYGDDLFLYQYAVYLDFVPVVKNIYTVVLTYEVYI